MKWTTGLSRNRKTSQAFDEAFQMLDVESAEEVDVVLIFFSAHHRDDIEGLTDQILRRFPETVFAGCSSGGVVSGGTAAQEEASLALVAGELPDVEIAPLRFEPDVHDRDDYDWSSHPRLDPSQKPHFLLFSDVETFDAEQLLVALDRQFPDSQKFGGLLGGGEAGDAMLLEGHTFRDGAVGLAFWGDLEIETRVAQACRPIGEPLIVTNHTKNVIHRFDKGNPMQVFRQTVQDLDEKDSELARDSMLVGIGLNHKYGQYSQGDFLIRNIVGFNPKSGDLAVAAAIDDLDVIQFHLLDPETSANEFERILDEYVGREENGDATRGVLLFSGVERGETFYGRADQEPELLREVLGALPIGGCFCAGEIGPVGQRTFLHGYASTLALFRERDDET